MLKIDLSSSLPAFVQPWSRSIAVGRGYELLRADLLDHLRGAVKEFGYRYCRFHGIFHDDVAVVRRRPDGSLAFQWHQADKIYDALMEMGVRPFVELNPMPAALASGTQTMFAWKGNVTPPRDFDEWGQLVSAFASHLVERYGLDEVAQWYFEVWNEPNLSGFWSGTKAQYWELYEASARAVKAVSSRLRMGGPATSKANWIGEFIGHCVDRNIPLDFISTHLYPQDVLNRTADEAKPEEEGGGFFIRKVREVQEKVRQSRRPDLEIHWTEWNALYAHEEKDLSWVANPAVDRLDAAALIARVCTALDSACDSFCYWTASDVFEECGMPHSPFSGTYGLKNIQGIPKASYRAFELLKRLRGERLGVAGLENPEGRRGAVATRENGVIRMLLWNHEPDPAKARDVWQETVQLPWSASPEARVIETVLRAGAGSPYETWKEMGSPHNLTSAELRLLQSHSQPAMRLLDGAANAGTLSLPVALAAGEVLMLEIARPGPAALSKGGEARELARWNEAMNAASRD